MYDEDHYSLDPEWAQLCGRSFGIAFGEALSSDYDGGLTILNEMLREFIDKASGDRLKCILAQRTYAEHACMLALGSQAPLEICDAAFAECERFGFRDLLTETTLGIVYARRLERCGKKEFAQSTLQKIQSKIDATVEALVAQRDLAARVLAQVS